VGSAADHGDSILQRRSAFRGIHTAGNIRSSSTPHQ
jgi:hypothetical protein